MSDNISQQLNLAWSLFDQGKLDAARSMYRK